MCTGSWFAKCFLILLLLAAQGIACAGTRVTIDGHNRLLLNGKLWFPIGLSPGPPLGGKDPLGRDPLDVVKAAGINCFRVGGQAADADRVEIPSEYVDLVGDHGMYVFVNLRELTVLDPQFSERREKLRAMIEKYREHPAMAAWKSMDEPTVGLRKTPVDQMLAAYKLIKQADPNHPVWLNHSPGGWHNYGLYRDVCDISGVDVYPISVPMGVASKLANRQISCIGDYMDIISKAMDGRKPILMVLQVGWSGASPPKHIRVFPTFHQERYMAYQAIINGANGLLFFGSQKALEGRDAELGFNWTFWNEILRPLMREIGEGSELHQAMMALPSKLPLEVKGAPDIEFTVREVGPYVYILAAKREGAEAPVSFSGDFLAGEAEVLFEGRKLPIMNGAFADRFGRNDVHVYRLRLDPPSVAH